MLQTSFKVLLILLFCASIVIREVSPTLFLFPFSNEVIYIIAIPVLYSILSLLNKPFEKKNYWQYLVITALPILLDTASSIEKIALKLIFLSIGFALTIVAKPLLSLKK